MPRPALLRRLRHLLLLATPQARAKGRISIIVSSPKNPQWAAEGDVAKATAAELG